MSCRPAPLALTALPPMDLLPADGLPLVLAACPDGAGASRPGLLQQWAISEHGWALAAHPSLCLAVGPRKATKKPYPSLAQLRACAPASALAVQIQCFQKQHLRKCSTSISLDKTSASSDTQNCLKRLALRT